MLHSGRVAFGAMEAVVFGKPAAESLAEEARRLDAERVFLMVSGTLNRMTDEIAKVRRALGNRVAGVFETGIFIGLCDVMIVGYPDRVEIIERTGT